MKTKTPFKKTNATWIELPSQPITEGEAASTNKVRTYSIRIKLDAPYPSPKTATTRNIDGDFVWDRLVTCKGRAEAVSLAGNWFQCLRSDGERRGGVGKVLAGKETHECVTVDDNWKECLYGSNFEPYGSHNRLLDKETIERVIEDSKGNLKIADSPFEKGRKYPSLEWATDKKINSLPIKIGFSTYTDPSEGGMKEAMDKALEKAKKRTMSWTREQELKEARIIVKRMKETGLVKNRESNMDAIFEKMSKSKHTKKPSKLTDEWIQKEEMKCLVRKKKLTPVKRVKKV